MPRYCRRSPPPSPSSAGRNDHVVPLANAEYLHQRIPNNRLVILETGHFAWEESPAEYATTILDAIAGPRA